MTNSKVRIGLSMRIIDAVGYTEPRDALAHNWLSFFKIALPEAICIPLPNIQKDIVGVIDAFNINALILTGGETPGTSTLRDETEDCLIGWAIDKQIPIMGVCRGIQKLILNFGGKLEECSEEEHVANRHKITWNNNVSREVNSYHQYGIKLSTLPKCFEPLAVTEDNKYVEAIKHKILPVWGLMWHPEREKTPDALDIELFRKIPEYIKLKH